MTTNGDETNASEIDLTALIQRAKVEAQKNAAVSSDAIQLSMTSLKKVFLGMIKKNEPVLSEEQMRQMEQEEEEKAGRATKRNCHGRWEKE